MLLPGLIDAHVHVTASTADLGTLGGKAVSQTGGHGDVRGPGTQVLDQHACCPI